MSTWMTSFPPPTRKSPTSSRCARPPRSSAILIPAFWPYSYDQQLGVRPGKPVDASFNNLAPFEYGKTELKRIEEGEKVFPHVFGTDSAGRDYFIRVVYGTRISLAVGFFASLIVLIIGMTVGSIAGYCGGKVDLIIMRIVDIIYSLPDTLMVILLATVLKVSIGDKLDGTPFSTGSRWQDSSAARSCPCVSRNTSSPRRRPAPRAAGSSPAIWCPTA